MIHMQMVFWNAYDIHITLSYKRNHNRKVAAFSAQTTLF